MKFSAVLASIGLAPAATLTDAKAQLATAKTQLDAVASLFASAGLDLDALLAEGKDALKTKLDSSAANASSAAALQADLTATQQNLTAALGAKSTAESALATAQAAATASAAKLTALAEALKPVGLDLAACSTAEGALDPAKLTAALKSTAHLKACELLATTGGAPLEETPAGEPAASAKGKADPKLTGRARVIAAFKAQSARK